MSQPAVEFSRVHKSFIPGKPVLTDLSFSLGPEEVIAIVGKSGRGKSTILRLAAGLLAPDSGSITWARRASDTALEVMLMNQKSSLFPWATALSNVVIALEAHCADKSKAKQAAEELLTTLGLRQSMNQYPAELSGGMRQRVALAQAIAGKPHLLLLDEPFGALDALTREEIQVEFMKWRSLHRASTLLVTHSIEEAAFLADRILVMRGIEPTCFAEFSASDLDKDELSHDAGYRFRPEFVELVGQVRSVLRDTEG